MIQVQTQCIRTGQFRRQISSRNTKAQESSSWLVYNLSQEPRNLKFHDDLAGWANDLQQADFQLKGPMYFTLLDSLIQHGKSHDTYYCHQLLWNFGIVPSKSQWLEGLKRFLESKSESASDALFQIFIKLPHDYQESISTSLLEWLHLRRPTSDLIMEKWLYGLALLGLLKPTSKNKFLFRRMIPFKRRSPVLDSTSFYRFYIRQIRKGSLGRVNQEYILDFVAVSAKMPKPYANEVMETFIDSIQRFHPQNRKRILNSKFWKCLIQSHVTLSHEMIIELVKKSGCDLSHEIYEEIILRNQDFEKCNILCDSFFNNSMGKQHKPGEKPQQLSLRVYSHMIRLLCRYSPSDARQVFEHPSVRSTPQLVIGYLHGMMEGRDYAGVIETYNQLLSHKLVSSNVWNFYVHALVKNKQVSNAVKLATESLMTHCSFELSASPSFISSALSSYNVRNKSKTEVSTPGPEKQEISSINPNLKLSPIYIPTPKPRTKSTHVENSTSWVFHDTPVQKCEYLIDSEVFGKVALAMIRYGRLIPSRTKNVTRKFVYGQPEIIERQVNISTDSQVSSVESNSRFPISQIIHFLRLGWNLNGKQNETGKKPGYQLHPGSISIILRDIQRGHLHVTKQEFIAFILALVDMYPPEESSNFQTEVNDVFFQSDVFNSSFISRIVYIGYLKSPRAPWISVSLLRDLHTQKGVQIDAKQVKDVLLHATSTVYGPEPVRGELKRVRHQLDHSTTVHDLAESFNNAWIGKAMSELDELDKSLPKVTSDTKPCI